MSSARFAAHSHSTWSYDGHFPLATVARILRSLGYRGVLMSEHDRGFDAERWAAYQEECARVSTPHFLVVPGIEYSSPDNVLHVPVWGQLPFLGESLDTDDLLPAVGEHGGSAVFAHPSRARAWERFRPEWVPNLLGIEIWNVKEDGYAPSVEGVELWRAHPRLLPFADLDFHTPRQLFPLALDVRLDGALTVDSVFAALRRREVGGLAYRTPVRLFADGRRRRQAETLERGRYWAFRKLKRIIRGHY
jgi:hypothetical protein